MSHETTATRRYVDESVGAVAGNLATHVGSPLLHVSAEDRARWSAGVKGDPGNDGRDGQDGQDGHDGQDGMSAFQIAQANGFRGTVTEWLASLKGDPGSDGQDGQNGQDGQDGQDGRNGVNGKSAYELAVDAGFSGTVTEWLASLKGDPGSDGQDGQNGQDGVGTVGATGKSAYEIAVEQGFDGGNEAAWLASLKGAKGDKGDPPTLGAPDVTMLPAGSSATVSVSGSAVTGYQLSFGIPKGDTGAPGVAGSSVSVKSFSQSDAPGGTSVLVLQDAQQDTRIEIHNGLDGANGTDGDDGKSAFEIAVEHGYSGGSEEAWLASLRGQDGAAVSINSMTAADRTALLGDVRQTLLDDPSFKGADGNVGPRGSYWHASDTGEFSGNDTTPGNFSGVGTYVDVAQPGDMLMMTATQKVYECIAAQGDTYDGVVQDASLWEFRIVVKGDHGDRGSHWHASDTGEFSGNDTTPGNFSGVGTYVDVAQPGDMLMMTATQKVYECIAAQGDTYDGVVQDASLWEFRLLVKGERGDTGPVATFVPADSLSNVVNQSSIWLETGSAFVFPCPTVATGQLLDYVLYVKATADVPVSASTAFSSLTEAGYTVRSNNDNLLDTITSGSIVAFTVSQMGTSSNVAIMRAVLNTVVAPVVAE